MGNTFDTCLACTQDFCGSTENDQKGHPTFIGEWSFGGFNQGWENSSQRKQVQDSYISCVSYGIGFYFWSWRADGGGEKWSMEQLTNNGWDAVPPDMSQYCQIADASWVLN